MQEFAALLIRQGAGKEGLGQTCAVLNVPQVIQYYL